MCRLREESLMTATVIVLVVSPGAKVRVPEAAR